MVTDTTLPFYAPPSAALQLCPLAARALYAEMMAWMRGLKITVLRRPDGAPYEDQEVARQLRITPEDLLGARPHLVREGFLVQGDDGAWVAPKLIEREQLLQEKAARKAAFEAAQAAGEIEVGTTHRQFASRQNGRNGGRTPIYTPGQRSMPFPQAVGGRSMDLVHGENPRGSSGSVDSVHGRGPDAVRDLVQHGGPVHGLTDCSSNESVRQSVQNSAREDAVHGPGPDGDLQGEDVPAAELKRLGQTMMRLVGLPLNSWGGNSGQIVRRWLATGMSEVQMVEAVERAAEHSRGRVTSLGWFLPVFRNASAALHDQEQPAASADAEVSLSDEDEARYQADAARWSTLLTERRFAEAGSRPRRADYVSRAA